MNPGKYLAAGTKVKVVEPTTVPPWSECDDDKGRTSVPTKRRLQQLFFRGDRKIAAEIVYIPNEDERDKLRRLGRIKVRVREPAGSSIAFTAPIDGLTKA